MGLYVGLPSLFYAIQALDPFGKTCKLSEEGGVTLFDH